MPRSLSTSRLSEARFNIQRDTAVLHRAAQGVQMLYGNFGGEYMMCTSYLLAVSEACEYSYLLESEGFLEADDLSVFERSVAAAVTLGYFTLDRPPHVK